jgi:hypothetical protein
MNTHGNRLPSSLKQWMIMIAFSLASTSSIASDNKNTSDPAPGPEDLLDLATCDPNPAETDCNESAPLESKPSPEVDASNTIALEQLRERSVTLANTKGYKILITWQEGDLDVKILDANKRQVGHIDIRIWTHVDSPAMGRNYTLAGQPVYKNQRKHSDKQDQLMTTYIVERYKGFIFVMTINSEIGSWFEANWKFL